MPLLSFSGSSRPISVDGPENVVNMGSAGKDGPEFSGKPQPVQWAKPEIWRWPTEMEKNRFS
jgi:hypothetical protein